MATLPRPSHPAGNGARPVGPDQRPNTPLSRPTGLGPGGVSRLDRVTLQLGVAVAVVIALCSYAVSATSLYALGRQAGYSWWQAAAVPVVADGPAIYGMFRIVSRSRRGARGAGYGWLLVIAGTRRRSAATSPTPTPTGSPRRSRRRFRWRCWPCWRASRATPARSLAWHKPGPRGRRRAARPFPRCHHRSTQRPHRRPGHRDSGGGLPAACATRRTRTDQQRHGGGAAAGGLRPTAPGWATLDRPHPGPGR
jgi:hypothetical protein